MSQSKAAHVIIGNSAAAIGAVEAIRKAGDHSSILLISDEPHGAYSRPLISELLAGVVTRERMLYRPDDFYERHQVDALLGHTVKKVDPKKNRVILEDDTEIGYKDLLIATGSSPFVPPIEGREAKGVFTFMKWEEAERLQEAAGRARHAVVIGAGLIGLKAAEALRHLGLEVTVVELAERILPAAADEKASALICEHLKREGIEVLTGNTVEKIESEDGAVCGVMLKSGERLSADMVVIAIGVRPNTQLVADTAIKVDRGIIVDEHMRSSVPNVFAAGDVAEGYDLLADQNRLLPIWPVAHRQGLVAGANMAGEKTAYEGYFAMNSIELFGLPLISMGYLEPPEAAGCEVLLKNEGPDYRKIILQEGKIVGALFLNAIDRAGIVSGLIREGTSVEKFKTELLKDDFGLLSLPKEWRTQKIGRPETEPKKRS